MCVCSAGQAVLVGYHILEDEHATTCVHPDLGNPQLALDSGESSAIASVVVGQTVCVHDDVVREAVYLVAEIANGVTGRKPSFIGTGNVDVQVVVVDLGHHSGIEVGSYTRRYSSTRRYFLRRRSQSFLSYGSPEGAIAHFETRQEKVFFEDLEVFSEGFGELVFVVPQ